jgi:hypothetical protein
VPINPAAVYVGPRWCRASCFAAWEPLRGPDWFWVWSTVSVVSWLLTAFVSDGGALRRL